MLDVIIDYICSQNQYFEYHTKGVKRGRIGQKIFAVLNRSQGSLNIIGNK